ncbi:hypothetical protein CsSME_00005468 [Camellia sinensis var. sinensis]
MAPHSLHRQVLTRQYTHRSNLFPTRLATRSTCSLITATTIPLSVDNDHDDSVWTMTWVPATDEQPALLLTGSLDETVRVWSPDELTSVPTNTGNCLGVVSVAAHPSGVIVASASILSSFFLLIS